MSALTKADKVTILRDSNGLPAFAVLPFADYQSLIHGKKKSEALIPSEVVNFAMDNDVSAIKAWREYLKYSQEEVAAMLDMTQSNYAQIEKSKNPRKSTREKVAAAFNILEEQLDF